MGEDHHVRELGADGADILHGVFLVHLASPVPADELIVQLRVAVGRSERGKDDVLAGFVGDVPREVLVGEKDDGVRAQ